MKSSHPARILTGGAAALFILVAITLLGLEFASVVKPLDIENDTVFAKVGQGSDAYVLSFSDEYSEPNIIYPTSRISSVFQPIRPDAFAVSPNGRWVFGYTKNAQNGTVTTTLAEINARQTYSLSNARWLSATTDNSFFYISTNGIHQLTYNFMDWETGRYIQFVTPMFVNRMVKLSQFGIPVNGWLLEHQPMIFADYRHLPNHPIQVTGFSSIDLSGIDLSHSGSYALPPRTPLVSGTDETGFGYLSPNGHYLAYLLPDVETENNYEVLFTSRTAAVIDLAAGESTTLQAADNALISNLIWRASDNALFYVQRSSGAKIFDVYQYDPVTRLSSALPLKLNGEIRSDATRIDVNVCGNTLFYVGEHVSEFGETSNTLYSVRLDSTESSHALFNADWIEGLQCADKSQWQPSRATTCPPLCTSTPPVPLSRDVTLLPLEGGNPVTGQALYEHWSCSGCHQMGVVAPITAGTMTRAVNEVAHISQLAGMTPEQYLAESILYPDAYVVPDYPIIHPKYYPIRLSISDLQDLIAYLMMQT